MPYIPKKPKVHLTVSITQEAYEVVDNYMVDMKCRPSQAIESLLRQASAYQNACETQNEMRLKERIRKEFRKEISK